ncbi:Septum formation initiator [Jonesia denitrificans DSM 20603]|uniref:Septum formation initiator n=2 Tax=Jonesia TaxID=43673 RepID=C7R007_JONDD|nr:Septum formation initiator [Jonesia denitrificans DSM 20603]
MAPRSQQTRGQSSSYRTTGRASGLLHTGTSRLVVLSLVILVCVSLLVPVVRNYMKQYNQLAELDEQITAQQTTNAELTNELRRWEDDNFVIAQARERLTFVFPGETPYRVMDSERAAIERERERQPTIKPAMKKPWYGTLWESIEDAGNGTPGDATEDQAPRDDSVAPDNDVTDNGETKPTDGAENPTDGGQ